MSNTPVDELHRQINEKLGLNTVTIDWLINLIRESHKGAPLITPKYLGYSTGMPIDAPKGTGEGETLDRHLMTCLVIARDNGQHNIIELVPVFEDLKAGVLQDREQYAAKKVLLAYSLGQRHTQELHNS